MSRRPRFSIGIDLGTTNSALAFVPLDRDAPAEIVAVPQLESAIAIIDAPTLPSFLYLPEDAPPRTAPDEACAAAAERWVIGRFARSTAADLPGRVVHSAKSWLAHHSADRSARFLPWGSGDVPVDDKLSPVDASALILRHLREAWNHRFAAEDAAFDDQIVTLTVPASFDAVAQRLTLAAARLAEFPAGVRVLEEPQAALYRWLDDHDPTAAEWAALHGASDAPRHLLVVDIGGGTSDFSLFAFHANAGNGVPFVERVAVSDHLLLGGDNMDLALANRLESQLGDAGEHLSGRQWEYLVARSRDVKERALGLEGSPGDSYSVSIPGRGSRLIAQATSAQVTRAELETLLFDGFFPACGADEYPVRATAALRELGLPYARDPAITRHLAEFLRGRPRVDAVLFNGGTLHPRRLRERLRDQIATWQGGAMPAMLENAEPDLAVAQGAARFGKLVDARAARIEAGTAHAIFLQAHRAAQADRDTLVCVLPQGAPTEHTFRIDDLALELRINRPVRFATFSSARYPTVRAGQIVAWNERDFQPLPALETAVRVAHSAGETVPVLLTARVSELGRLDVWCESADARSPGRWPLEFDLRAAGLNGDPATRPATSGDAGENGLGVAAGALAAAQTRLKTRFEQAPNPRDKLTATRLLTSLEALLGQPKSGWNVVLVRTLWSTLAQCTPHRAKSVDHAEAWLILAGFLLRPGFGAAGDEVRIDQLWSVRDGRPCTSRAVAIQEYVLWRRVAGGLSNARQAAVLEPELATLRDGRNPPPELVLLAGSLERLNVALKSELADRFIDLATALQREKRHNAHVLAALGSLLSRAPLYGGPEVVVAPELVQRAFDALAAFDWEGPRVAEFAALFVRAARVVDNRGIDVSRSLRQRIADRLERAGLPAARTAALKGYLPVQRAERAGSFGESLPPGLILREIDPTGGLETSNA